jgi:hypothetical protein
MKTGKTGWRTYHAPHTGKTAAKARENGQDGEADTLS